MARKRVQRSGERSSEGVTLKRRFGKADSSTRMTLLDTTEQIMISEGYAAVTTRRVATLAGMKAPIVHYYFPTMDDLLVAVYRRMADHNMEVLIKVLASPQPLRSLWKYNCDQGRTGLALEFLALANHRKEIRLEIAHRAAGFRKMQADALARALKERPLYPDCAPIGVTVLVAGLARILVMETTLGVSSGHAEARAFVEALLRRFERKPPQETPRRRPASAKLRAAKAALD